MQYFWMTLTILFVGLKLTNHIYWSWWYVLLPMYGGLALMIAVWVIGWVGILGFQVLSKRGKRNG